jgi:hypothetical protein
VLDVPRGLAAVIGADEDIASGDHQGADVLGKLNQATGEREIALPLVVQPVMFALDGEQGR